LAAAAGPVTWTVDLTFADGGTAMGTFVFDADAGTACTTTNTPCGLYSDVDIVTTTGSSLTGTTYNTVCGVGGVISCDGASPDSTEALFLTSGATNQTGAQGLALFYLPAGLLPPNGLSDLGGSFDMSNTTGGVANESFCNDATCDQPTGASRVSVSGTVATPEPSTALLLAASLTILGLARFASRRRRA